MTVENDAKQYKKTIDLYKAKLQTISLAVLLTVVFILVLSIIGNPTLNFVSFVIAVLTYILMLTMITFYYDGEYTTQINMVFDGYNLKWRPQTATFFGWNTYKIIKADTGLLFGHSFKMNDNPFATDRHSFKQLKEKQREEANCVICQTELFTGITDEAYYLETRKQFYVGYFIVYEKTVNWDGYCEEHKPIPNRYEKLT